MRLFIAHFKIFVVVAIAVFMAQTAQTARADFYSWDFLTGEFDNVSLTPFGDGAVNLARPTKKGLRLRLPVGEKTTGIGFATRFQIRGDFEITMRYKIDKLATPEDGWGAGPSLYLTTVSDRQPAVQLSRLTRKDDREIHSLFRAMPVEGERTKLHKQFDSVTKHGQLRITRSGSSVVWSVANGLSTEFTDLHADDFDPGDVGLVRVSLQQSAPSTGGEILIEHLSITADELPHMPGKLTQNDRIYQPKYRPTYVAASRRWIGYLACAVFLAAGTIVWFVKGR